jgi:hypothetical protein
VTIGGLAEDTLLSQGSSRGWAGWLLAARDLDKTFVGPPKDFVGVMDATVKLSSAGGQLLESQVIRFEWIAKTEDVLPPTLEPPEPAQVVQSLNAEQIAKSSITVFPYIINSLCYRIGIRTGDCTFYTLYSVTHPRDSLLHCNVGLATYKVPRNLSEFHFLKAKCHARKRSACIYRDEHRVRQRHRARAQAVRNVRRTITASHDLCPKSDN